MDLLLQTLRQQWLVLGSFAAVMIGLRFLDARLGGRLLNQLALEPRTVPAPITFFAYAFMHLDRQHLFGNLLYFFAFGWLILFQGIRNFLLVTLLITFLTALGVWLFGTKGSRQVGSSGLNLGYLGYLMSAGLFNADVGMIVLSLFVFLIFHGLFRQILPWQRGVSTSGHFFGFLSGIATAWLLTWYYTQ